MLQEAIRKRKEQQHQFLNQIDDEHEREINSIIKHNFHQKNELETAYKVELSKIEESQETELAKIRDNFIKNFDEEEEEQEFAFKQLSDRGVAETTSFKQKHDKTLAKMHAEYTDTMEAFELNYPED